ncbi:hypothetical protein B0O80DRAFT_438823 [Mortierella sp. GBAus27b]|nr:hypothetical protein B0O80DRAFT_438823 [Mortierella sp. GBAus27b]
MVAPTKNLLAKSMLSHIGIALALGSVSAYGFWHKVVLPSRVAREQFYIKDKAARA